MTGPVKIGRRDLLTGAAGLAGATVARAAWAQGQAPPPAGRRGAAEAPAVVGTWVSTTETAPWQTKAVESRRGFGWDTLDLRVRVDRLAQVIDGFGGCFNELGWMSLQLLNDADRDAVMRELFAPGVGGNFSICRMPVAANDFSRDWYSYDETADDFDLKRFSVANDQETLIPFIRAARKHQSALRLWASPWSPPSWMKVNAHYAAAQSRGGNASNGLRPDQVGREGTDMFRLEERYLDAYARYFGKFIDGYREAGIPIAMVMPQNEFNSAQPFPSCIWTGPALARFIRHLGPEMAKRNVEVYFGTLERANVGLFEPSMKDAEAGRYIKGVGVQWAGKGAVADIARLYPKLKLYQSEQECGDGKNDWRYAGYTWQLMKHYFRSGAHAYLYWNISLESGGISHWGWRQNSLVTVDPAAKTFKWNHEYHILKHLSHFVLPGATRVETEGTMDDALAFRNRDGGVVAVLRNARAAAQAVTLAVGDMSLTLTLDPDSYNTVAFAAPK
jgi:glucosylceramidase